MRNQGHLAVQMLRELLTHALHVVAVIRQMFQSSCPALQLIPRRIAPSTLPESGFKLSSYLSVSSRPVKVHRCFMRELGDTHRYF